MLGPVFHWLAPARRRLRVQRGCVLTVTMPQIFGSALGLFGVIVGIIMSSPAYIR